LKCPKCHIDNPDTSRFCGSCAAVLSSEGQPPVSFTKTLETPVYALSKDSSIAGKYRIIEEIGRGGMGVVYKAEDIKLKRPVALKFLPYQWVSDQDARERFIQEARAASALDHPNICNIYEIGEAEYDRMYIAMAFYDGESLREKIKHGPLKLEEALGIAIQAATGMAKAHQKGIVHRDIKPANLLVTSDGVVKVVDFGLAKLSGQVKLTREGTTVGTVAYMSPEQAKGEAVDLRTDIWSLGVVLYEMLSGVLPFKGDYEQTLIHSILQLEPERVAKLRKDLPLGLENIIFKALAKKPPDRYQSMDELLEDLQSVAEGLEPVRATSSIFRGRVLGLKKVYAYPIIGLLVGFALIAVLLIFPKRGHSFDSIAVLPLINSSGNPEQEMFCDSVHRELITQLSRIKAIRTVIAKQTMMAFKGTTKKSSEIAKELDVSAIVSGEVRRSGDNVQIVFELIDGRNDKLLGEDSVQGDYRDILTVQGKAALAIAREIKSALTPEETRALSEQKRVIPEAYEAYLKGKQILDQTGVGWWIQPAELDKSLSFFDQALGIDPEFALAYAGKALAYDIYGSFIGPFKVYASKAKEAALKARSLDRALPDPPLVLADVLLNGWEYEAGMDEFKNVLKLYPNNAYAHAFYANAVYIFDKELALTHGDRARELDPQNYTLAELIATAYYMAGDFKRTTDLARKMTSLFPNKPEAHLMAAWHLPWIGQIKEAWTEYQRAIELGSPDEPLFRAYLFAMSGEKPKSREIINEYLDKTNDKNLLVAKGLVYVYSLLDEKDKTFSWLDWLYDQRWNGMPIIKCAPYFNNIRSDPRYDVLLKKIGLGK
jgi:serine/threonine-protein kinase